MGRRAKHAAGDHVLELHPGDAPGTHQLVIQQPNVMFQVRCTTEELEELAGSLPAYLELYHNLPGGPQ